ncbi:MAG: helix-turn-helix domain-containing protein [Rhodobacteraceae bacterium]|nr:helix-turn-helix domain-containing protein [Paracoccaceae bacterium]
MTMSVYRELPPSPRDAEIARHTSQLLAKYAAESKPLSFRINKPELAEVIDLPEGAVKLLHEILEVMATGRGVTIIPVNTELTTVQASDILNVSRPYLIKLLEEGAIPHHKVGRHRRVLTKDIIAYKKSIDAKRKKILEQLTAEAQEDDMGYN